MGVCGSGWVSAAPGVCGSDWGDLAEMIGDFPSMGIQARCLWLRYCGSASLINVPSDSKSLAVLLPFVSLRPLSGGHDHFEHDMRASVTT